MMVYILVEGPIESLLGLATVLVGLMFYPCYRREYREHEGGENPRVR